MNRRDKLEIAAAVLASSRTRVKAFSGTFERVKRRPVTGRPGKAFAS